MLLHCQPEVRSMNKTVGIFHIRFQFTSQYLPRHEFFLFWGWKITRICKCHILGRRWKFTWWLLASEACLCHWFGTINRSSDDRASRNSLGAIMYCPSQRWYQSTQWCCTKYDPERFSHGVYQYYKHIWCPVILLRNLDPKKGLFVRWHATHFTFYRTS